MTKRHAFLSALCVIGTCLLSGCKLVLLDPKGPIAADEKHIIITSVLLMLIVVIPVIFLTLIFAWRYRESNTKATYSPQWTHSNLLEVICWSIPCIIIAILGTITWKSSHRLDPFKPLVMKQAPLTIEAISLEWKWLFIYPQQNIATINEIKFPVGTPVHFLISAEGPMNSFQIPQLGGQIYAMAGMQSQLYLAANSPGNYLGISTNLTGLGFSNMQFKVNACTPEEFQKWVDRVKSSPEKLTLEKYNALTQPTEHNKIEYFSSTNNEIFNAVVMKSMMPMQTR